MVNVAGADIPCSRQSGKYPEKVRIQMSLQKSASGTIRKKIALYLSVLGQVENLACVKQAYSKRLLKKGIMTT